LTTTTTPTTPLTTASSAIALHAQTFTLVHVCPFNLILVCAAALVALAYSVIVSHFNKSMSLLYSKPWVGLFALLLLSVYSQNLSDGDDNVGVYHGTASHEESAASSTRPLSDAGYDALEDSDSVNDYDPTYPELARRRLTPSRCFNHLVPDGYYQRLLHKSETVVPVLKALVTNTRLQCHSRKYPNITWNGELLTLPAGSKVSLQVGSLNPHSEFTSKSRNRADARGWNRARRDVARRLATYVGYNTLDQRRLISRTPRSRRL
jgi:hypothetical protein